MAATIARHTLAHDPIGLWQFNETLNDTSGSAFNFTVETGQERYTDIFPGFRGLLLESTRLVFNTAQATLRITGNITIEAIVYLLSQPGASALALVSHENTGETSNDNCLYSLELGATHGNLGFFTENGSGSDSTYSISNVLTPGSLCHVAVTRTSNVIQFYLNGRTFGSASSALTTPTGGTSGRLRVGYNGTTAPECVLSSLKIVTSALSSTQIAAEYNQTIGPLLGLV